MCGHAYWHRALILGLTTASWVGDEPACGPFLWYTPNRRGHTGGGKVATRKTTTGRCFPETAAETAAARKEHAELRALSPIARDEKTMTVLDIRLDLFQYQ